MPFSDDRVIEGHIQVSSILRFCSIAFANKLLIGGGALGLALGAASWAATSWLSGKLADRLIFLSHQHAAFASDWQVRALLFGVCAAVSVMYLGNKYGRLCINKSLIEALRKIHDQALQSTLGAPMLFFQRTSTGRILSRFANDFANAANSFDRIIATFVYALFAMLFSIFLIASSKPILILISIPFCVLLYGVSRFYGRRARDEQRQASKSNAHCLGLFGEALAGTHLIRTFGVREPFQKQLEKLQQDASQLSHKPLQTANTRTLVQAALALAMTLCTMIVSHQAVQTGELTIGEAGANVTLIMLILRNFLLVVELLTTLEVGFTSVERLNEYVELEQEETCSTDAKGSEPTGQPFASNLQDFDHQADALRIENLDARYAVELPLVLQQLRVRIRSGERVGLVGRTGSGKSTLVQALYRLIPVAPGTIFLAGLDITQLPLGVLRRALAIVPQDPVLFQGTLLENICQHANTVPQPEETRMAIALQALEKVNLRAWAESLTDGMQTKIEERGSNLSQGQKQLVCLARALATNPILLILDEATSSVDPETEQLVTKTVHLATKEQTTLIIAHHLSTVESCDRILYMEDGRIVEDGQPAALLANPHSRYAKLRSAALEKGGRFN